MEKKRTVNQKKRKAGKVDGEMDKRGKRRKAQGKTFQGRGAEKKG